MRNMMIATLASWLLAGPAAAAPMSLKGAMAYPFTSGLVSSPDGTRIAWVREVAGVRNIWVASGSGAQPVRVTGFAADDGQELTQLVFGADGQSLFFGRPIPPPVRMSPR
jgi:hypothetical protein